MRAHKMYVNISHACFLNYDNCTATLLLWDINNHFGGAGNRWQTEAWRRVQRELDAWAAAPFEDGGSSSAKTTTGAFPYNP